MVYWSVGLALVGLLGSGGILFYLGRSGNFPITEYAWLVGLASLAPAWLVVVLSLLGETPAEVIDTPLPRSVLVTSAAALLGVIFTDTLNRRFLSKEPKPAPLTGWLLGVVSLVPAWIIALWALE